MQTSLQIKQTEMNKNSVKCIAKNQDSNNNFFINAIAPLDLIENRTIAPQHTPTRIDPARRDSTIEILPDLFGELRLVSVERDDLSVVTDAGKGCVEGLRCDTFSQRARPEIQNPLIEPGTRRRDRHDLGDLWPDERTRRGRGRACDEFSSFDGP